MKYFDRLGRQTPHERVLPEAVAGAPESTVPWAVADDSCCPAATRRWRRSPELPGFFVAKIDSLARRIAARFVAPRREAVHLAVPCPRVAAAGFRHETAEVGVGDHVAPGGWWPLAATYADDVFTTIPSEPTQTVVEKQVLHTGCQWLAGGGKWGVTGFPIQFPRGSGWVQLLGQCPVAVAKDYTGCGFQERVGVWE